MDAFAERMERLGITFDLAPTVVESVGLEIAFITDPAGTYIEVTEGLADIE
jgi:extradiol dioxygenase family protein